MQDKNIQNYEKCLNLHKIGFKIPYSTVTSQNIVKYFELH